MGTRLDLAECLQFAGDGKVKVHYSTERLEDINSIFGRMRDNKIDGPRGHENLAETGPRRGQSKMLRSTCRSRRKQAETVPGAFC